MSQSRTAGVHAVFERWLDQPPERREAFLDRACAGDPALRARIEQLARLAGQEGFLDSPALRIGAPHAAAGSAWSAGQAIGAWRLLQPLGRGGMAEVWLAERSEGGVRQEAALKLIARAGQSLARRFAAEQSILAALTHPGIARLYGGGIEADGTAWMVMQYVDGVHLLDHVAARMPGLAERLGLFLQVCDAVAYAIRAWWSIATSSRPTSS